jgi:hypothetical protein
MFREEEREQEREQEREEEELLNRDSIHRQRGDIDIC